MMPAGIDFKNSTYRLNRDIAARLVDGSYYAVDSRQQILHSFNETGTYIYTKIAAGSGYSGILKALSDEYDISEENAEKDLQGFMTGLIEKGILVTVENKH
ncbi:MAG: PqqD family protein [Elusimicrobiota bacterium]